MYTNGSRSLLTSTKINIYSNEKNDHETSEINKIVLIFLKIQRLTGKL
jgi:hypothetical protein